MVCIEEQVLILNWNWAWIIILYVFLFWPIYKNCSNWFIDVSLKKVGMLFFFIQQHVQNLVSNFSCWKWLRICSVGYYQLLYTPKGLLNVTFQKKIIRINTFFTLQNIFFCLPTIRLKWWVSELKQTIFWFIGLRGSALERVIPTWIQYT